MLEAHSLKNKSSGGGIVVSVLAFHSDDPSSDLAGNYLYLLYLEKMKINDKQARQARFFKYLLKSIGQQFEHVIFLNWAWGEKFWHCNDGLKKLECYRVL